jgi:hypothetical protein
MSDFLGILRAVKCKKLGCKMLRRGLWCDVLVECVEGARCWPVRCLISGQLELRRHMITIWVADRGCHVTMCTQHHLEALRL